MEVAFCRSQKHITKHTPPHLIYYRRLYINNNPLLYC